MRSLRSVPGSVAGLVLALSAGEPVQAGKIFEKYWGNIDGGDYAAGPWFYIDDKGDPVPTSPPEFFQFAILNFGALIPARTAYTITVTTAPTVEGVDVADDVTLDCTGSILNVSSDVSILPDFDEPSTLTLAGGSLSVNGDLVVGVDAVEAARSSFILSDVATLVIQGDLRVRPSGFADLRKGFAGGLRNAGTVALRPGSQATVNATVGFTQFGPTSGGGVTTPGGTLSMEVFSPGLYDQLRTGGAATLGGTLVVRRDEKGFFPLGTVVPDIIRATSITGRFDAVLFTPAFPENLRFRINYPTFARAEAGKFIGIDLEVVELPPQPNVGDGSQGASAITGRPVSAVAADFNGDGFPDLAGAVPALAANTGGPIGGGVVVVLNLGVDGNGDWLGFGPAATYLPGLGPVSIAAGDLDQDGDRDLAVVNPGNSPFPAGLRVLLNDGAGAFTAFGAPADSFVDVGADPRGVAIGNFIADPADLLDLAVTSLDGPGGPGQVVIVENQGSPAIRAWNGLVRFQRFPVATDDPGTIQPGGLDNPKDVDDLAIGAGPGGGGGGGESNLFVFFNTNDPDPDPLTPLFNGGQSIPVGAGPEHLSIIDMDNDGDADIVTSNRDAGTVSIVQNLGPDPEGGLFAVQSLSAGATPGPLAVLDIDADSDRDLAVVVDDESSPGDRFIQVLRNDTPIGNVGGPLVFALGQTFGQTAGPLFILPGDADLDGDADLLAFTDPPAAPTEQATAFLNALCATDLDGSGGTGLGDLTRFLSDFGRSVPAGDPGDFDLDGAITTADLVVLLGFFGAPCR